MPQYKNYSTLCLFGRVRKTVKTDYKRRLVCPFVRMEQLGFHLTDFQEILYLIIFGKLCTGNLSLIQICKSDGYFI
jgi:hypothetical protein